jgi:hypothetical protein
MRSRVTITWPATQLSSTGGLSQDDWGNWMDACPSPTKARKREVNQ